MTTYLFSGAVAYESVYISQEKKEKKSGGYARRKRSTQLHRENQSVW